MVTVLDGIRMRADDEIQIAYGQGCDLIDPGIERIAEAVELARGADVAIVVVGDTLTQNGEIRDEPNWI